MIRNDLPNRSCQQGHQCPHHILLLFNITFCTGHTELLLKPKVKTGYCLWFSSVQTTVTHFDRSIAKKPPVIPGLFFCQLCDDNCTHLTSFTKEQEQMLYFFLFTPRIIKESAKETRQICLNRSAATQLRPLNLLLLLYSPSQ